MTATANILPLKTDRLELEPLEATHAEELFLLLLDPCLHTYMEGDAQDFQRHGYAKEGMRGFEWAKTTNKAATFKGFESHEFRF